MIYIVSTSVSSAKTWQVEHGLVNARDVRIITDASAVRGCHIESSDVVAFPPCSWTPNRKVAVIEALLDAGWRSTNPDSWPTVDQMRATRAGLSRIARLDPSWEPMSSP